MTKVNLNNGNETKLNSFHGKYSNLTSFFIVHKILKTKKTFINAIFQFHCEHKQVK